MAKKGAPIFNLEDYGLNLKDLKRLGSRMVKVKVDFPHYSEKKIFRYPPKERHRISGEYRRECLRSLLKNWPSKEYSIFESKDRPIGIVSSVAARDIPAILKRKQVASIWVVGIKGRKKKPKRDHDEEYYSVKARFSIQIEGERNGMQKYEDRIVLLKAFHFEDAIRRLKREFRQYGSPYLNTKGYRVRWHFEKVLDVYRTYEKIIDPKGTEVYSELHTRKLNRKLQWLPDLKNRK